MNATINFVCLRIVQFHFCVIVVVTEKKPICPDHWTDTTLSGLHWTWLKFCVFLSISVVPRWSFCLWNLFLMLHIILLRPQYPHICPVSQYWFSVLWNSRFSVVSCCQITQNCQFATDTNVHCALEVEHSPEFIKLHCIIYYTRPYWYKSLLL